VDVVVERSGPGPMTVATDWRALVYQQFRESDTVKK